MDLESNLYVIETRMHRTAYLGIPYYAKITTSRLNLLQLLLDKIPPDQYLLLHFLYNALVSSEQYPTYFISLRPRPIPTILGCLVYHLVQVFSSYLGGQEMIYAHEPNRKTMACREVAENQEDNEPNWVCH